MATAFLKCGLLCAMSLMALHLIVGPVLVDAIQCWQCNSNEDPGCDDPFDNKTFYKVDCRSQDDLVHLPDVKATMCRKIRQKVQGRWRVVRGCARLGSVGVGGDERFCHTSFGTTDVYVEDCTCNSKDGCNTAPSVVSAHATLLVVIATGCSLVAALTAPLL